jgi:hypothetical protein
MVWIAEEGVEVIAHLGLNLLQTSTKNKSYLESILQRVGACSSGRTQGPQFKSWYCQNR